MQFNEPHEWVDAEPVRFPVLNREWRDNLLYLKSKLPAVGEPRIWFDDEIPEHWLVLNGQAVSRTDYPELFAAYGTLHGAGDGLTTFNLPDLRGRFPVGRNAARALASTGGSKTATLTVSTMAPHVHEGGDHDHDLDIESKNVNVTVGGDDIHAPHPVGIGSGDVLTSALTGASTDPAGNAIVTPFSIMNPFIAAHYIVRAR